MSSLEVNLTVDPSAIGNFQGSEYVLCLAKSIKNDNHETTGNIIFATIPSNKLAPSMRFTWTDKYQVYQTNTGGSHQGSTLAYSIDRGQTAKFKTDGSAEVTGPSLPDKPIIVVNNWQDWSCMGVKVFNTTETPGKFRTFYISKANPLSAQANLTPIRKYQIFWATNVTIEDEIPHALRHVNLLDSLDSYTHPYMIDLTESNSINLTYQSSGWERA